MNLAQKRSIIICGIFILLSIFQILSGSKASYFFLGLFSFFAITLFITQSDHYKIAQTKKMFRKWIYKCYGQKYDKERFEIIERFLIEDNIDPENFKKNMDYYYGNQGEKQGKTSSCPTETIVLNSHYPFWFAAAYPDIIKFYRKSSEEENDRVIQNLGFFKDKSGKLDPIASKILDKHKLFFTLDFLYKLKEYYKKTNPGKKLENRRSFDLDLLDD